MKTLSRYVRCEIFSLPCTFSQKAPGGHAPPEQGSKPKKEIIGSGQQGTQYRKEVKRNQGDYKIIFIHQA